MPFKKEFSEEEKLLIASMLINASTDFIRMLLKIKNKNYNNSAFDPKNILSKGTALEQNLTRIDDKLGRGKITFELLRDLAGYFVLAMNNYIIEIHFNCQSFEAFLCKMNIEEKLLKTKEGQQELNNNLWRSLFDDALKKIKEESEVI